GRFLRLFTELSLSEIARLEALSGAEINAAKEILATEATLLAHGREAADGAVKAARQAFDQVIRPVGIASTASVGTPTIMAGLPVVEIPDTELQAGIPAFRLFVLSGLATSNGEARRLIRGGGGRINDAPVAEEDTLVVAA